jgi:uroporphyrinogen-III synthase
VRTAVIRAEEGRDELIHELRRRGGEVDLAVAYRNVAEDADPAQLGEFDIVTFTSASTVDRFFERTTPGHALLASIGPATSDAIRRYGRKPDIVAKEATIQALHDAVVECGGKATAF